MLRYMILFLLLSGISCKSCNRNSTSIPLFARNIIRTLSIFQEQYHRLTVTHLPGDILKQKINYVLSQTPDGLITLISYRIRDPYDSKQSYQGGCCQFNKKFVFDISTINDEIYARGVIRIQRGNSTKMVRFEVVYKGAVMHVKSEDKYHLPHQTVTYDSMHVKLEPRNAETSIVESLLKNSTLLLSPLEMRLARMLAEYGSSFRFMIWECLRDELFFSNDYFFCNESSQSDVFMYGLADFKTLAISRDSKYLRLVLETHQLRGDVNRYDKLSELTKFDSFRCGGLHVEVSFAIVQRNYLSKTPLPKINSSITKPCVYEFNATTKSDDFLSSISLQAEQFISRLLHF